MVWEISCGAAYIDGFSWLDPQVSWSQPVQEEKSTGALQLLCVFLSVSNLLVYFSLLLLHFLCTLPLLFLCFFAVLSIGRFLAVFGHFFGLLPSFCVCFNVALCSALVCPTLCLICISLYLLWVSMVFLCLSVDICFTANLNHTMDMQEDWCKTATQEVR